MSYRGMLGVEAVLPGGESLGEDPEDLDEAWEDDGLPPRIFILSMACPSDAPFDTYQTTSIYFTTINTFMVHKNFNRTLNFSQFRWLAVAVILSLPPSDWSVLYLEVALKSSADIPRLSVGQQKQRPDRVPVLVWPQPAAWEHLQILGLLREANRREPFLLLPPWLLVTLFIVSHGWLMWLLLLLSCLLAWFSNRSL